MIQQIQSNNQMLFADDAFRTWLLENHSSKEGIEPAYSNIRAISFSVRKTYLLLYLDAMPEQTRITRLNKIVERLNKNLKPM